MNEYRKQYASRNKKLASIGMTYAEYLKSSHWFLVKTLAFREKRFEKCFICGETDFLQLHHMKYGKIVKFDKIRQQLTYLVALCRLHHYEVHETAKKVGCGLKRAVKYVKTRYEKRKNQLSTPVKEEYKGLAIIEKVEVTRK